MGLLVRGVCSWSCSWLVCTGVACLLRFAWRSVSGAVCWPALPAAVLSLSRVHLAKVKQRVRVRFDGFWSEVCSSARVLRAGFICDVLLGAFSSVPSTSRIYIVHGSHIYRSTASAASETASNLRCANAASPSETASNLCANTAAARTVTKRHRRNKQQKRCVTPRSRWPQPHWASPCSVY